MIKNSVIAPACCACLRAQRVISSAALCVAILAALPPSSAAGHTRNARPSSLIVQKPKKNRALLREASKSRIGLERWLRGELQNLVKEEAPPFVSRNAQARITSIYGAARKKANKIASAEITRAKRLREARKLEKSVSVLADLLQKDDLVAPKSTEPDLGSLYPRGGIFNGRPLGMEPYYVEKVKGALKSATEALVLGVDSAEKQGTGSARSATSESAAAKSAAANSEGLLQEKLSTLDGIGEGHPALKALESVNITTVGGVLADLGRVRALFQWKKHFTDLIAAISGSAAIPLGELIEQAQQGSYK